MNTYIPLNEDQMRSSTPLKDFTPLVRKLGAMCLLSEQEIEFLEGLQINTQTVDPRQNFITEDDTLKRTYVVLSGWAVRYVLLTRPL